MTNNLRQRYINIDRRAAMADDGILDVFMDVDGITRRVGVPIGEQNQQTIKEALTYFDDLTGVRRFVATEAESELHHQLDATWTRFRDLGQCPALRVWFIKVVGTLSLRRVTLVLTALGQSSARDGTHYGAGNEGPGVPRAVKPLWVMTTTGSTDTQQQTLLAQALYA